MAALSILTVLFGLSLALCAIVAVPIVLTLVAVFLVLKLVFFVLFLPFRIIKVAIGVGMTGALGALCLAGGAVAGLCGLVLLLIGAVPLLPIALAAVILYFLLRRPRPALS
jgi:hypothetical protein